MFDSMQTPMISREHNCIFVHIPRTGGTSIENMIWAPEEKHEKNLWRGMVTKYDNPYQTGGLQHLRACQIRACVGAQFFDNALVFTMVRNPFDRMLSQYRYMSVRQDLRDYIGMKEGDSFNRYLDLIDRIEHVQWMPQHAFINDDDGRRLVDHILQFENYEQEVRVLLKKLNIACDDIRRDNESPACMPAPGYDLEAFEKVSARYREDFETLNYEIPPFEQTLQAGGLPRGELPL